MAIGVEVDVYGRPTKPPVYDHIQVTISAGLTPVRILEADPDRVAVYIQANGNTDVRASLNNNVSSSTGYLLKSGNPPIIITDRDAPGLAGRAMWAISVSGTATIEVASVRRNC